MLVMTVPPVVEGKVKEVESVPEKVSELSMARVFPFAISSELEPLLTIFKPLNVPEAKTLPVADTENLDTGTPPAESDLCRSIKFPV